MRVPARAFSKFPRTRSRPGWNARRATSTVVRSSALERIIAIRSRSEAVGSYRPLLLRHLTPRTVRKKETFEPPIDWQENRYEPAIPHLNHVLPGRLFNERRSRVLRRDRAMRCSGSITSLGRIRPAARPGEQARLLGPGTLGRLVSLRRRRAITLHSRQSGPHHCANFGSGKPTIGPAGRRHTRKLGHRRT
jgi:hypothetical protein